MFNIKYKINLFLMKNKQLGSYHFFYLIVIKKYIGIGNLRLEKDLHNYFKDYKTFSNQFNLSHNKNGYGIINSENELEETNKYINLILDEEEDEYNFAPPQLDFARVKFSKDSILLNKEIKEYNNIYNDYYKRIIKNKIIFEKDEENAQQNEIKEKINNSKKGNNLLNKKNNIVVK